MRNKSIKWTKRQSEKLSKAVQRFNRKLTREGKRNPALKPYLPARKSVRDLKKTIKTARDLEQLVRSVERAFRPGAFDVVNTPTGVTTTKYEVNELKLGVRRINRYRKQQLEKLGLDTPEKIKEKGASAMMEAENLRPKPFDLNKIKASDWDAFVHSVEVQGKSSFFDVRDERYKKNYLKAVEINLGGYGYHLYNYVLNLPAAIVVAGMENPVLTITYLYSPIDREEKADTVLENWKRFYEGYEG